MPDVSAIICTHNRSNLLTKTIQSLLDQTLDADQYEIIVVDNASTDDTQKVVEPFCRQHPEIRYVYEPDLGIARARNRGYREASAEIVAYLDDDAVAAPDWLAAMLDTHARVQPRPACVGGKALPHWEVSRPKWLSSKLEPFVSVFDHGNEPRFVSHDTALAAENISYRRDALLEVGGFDPRMGHAGSRLTGSGEETELAERLERAGHKLYYQPRARVHHLVHAPRMTKDYFYRRSYWQGYSDSVQAYLERPRSKGVQRVWFSARRMGPGFSWLLIRLGGFLCLYPVSSPGERVRRFCMVCAAWGRIRHEVAHLFHTCACRVA